MSVYISLVVVFLFLLTSVIMNISIVWPLSAGLLVFIGVAYTQGFRIKELLKMSMAGVKKTTLIYVLLLFIGPTTSLWMISGTIPFLISSGISLISPSTFLLAVFIGTLAVALLFGSAFATVGTIGVVFMAMARTGNVDTAMTAGIIVTAAYMGERFTPVSTTLNLLTILTKTDLYSNIKMLFKSTLIPLVITFVFFGALSFFNPVSGDVTASVSVIRTSFHLGWPTALPAIIVILLAVFKLDVRKILAASMLTAVLVGIFYQNLNLQSIVEAMILGYHPIKNDALASMLHGGGLISIVKSFFIVFIASAYGGIFQQTNMLFSFQNMIHRIAEKFGLFSATLFTSILSNCFGCSQTFGIVTTHQFVEDTYHKKFETEDAGNIALCSDIGNTAFVIAPLIPWNISSAFPAAVLAVSLNFIPYAIFLWLTPLYLLFYKSIKWYNLRK